jgi:hypothetical protein
MTPRSGANGSERLAEHKPIAEGKLDAGLIVQQPLHN